MTEKRKGKESIVLRKDKEEGVVEEKEEEEEKEEITDLDNTRVYIVHSSFGNETFESVLRQPVVVPYENINIVNHMIAMFEDYQIQRQKQLILTTTSSSSISSSNLLKRKRQEKSIAYKDDDIIDKNDDNRDNDVHVTDPTLPHDMKNILTVEKILNHKIFSPKLIFNKDGSHTSTKLNSIKCHGTEADVLKMLLTFTAAGALTVVS